MVNIREICKRISLANRIKVLSEMDFISLLTELGYREEKSWGPEEDEILRKLCELAQKHTEEIFKTIDEWKQDGSPE